MPSAWRTSFMGARRLEATLRSGGMAQATPATLTLWASEDFWVAPRGQRISYFSRGAYFTARVFFRGHPPVHGTVRLR